MPTAGIGMHESFKSLGLLLSVGMAWHVINANVKKALASADTGKGDGSVSRSVRVLEYLDVSKAKEALAAARGGKDKDKKVSADF